MFLNTISNPVKWSCPVCKHVKMATLDRDVNLTCLIFRGMLRVWKKIWGKWRDDISKLHEQFYGTIFIYRVYRPAATNYRAGFFLKIFTNTYVIIQDCWLANYLTIFELVYWRLVIDDNLIHVMYSKSSVSHWTCGGVPSRISIPSIRNTATQMPHFAVWSLTMVKVY